MTSSIIRPAIEAGLKFPLGNEVVLPPENTFGVFVSVERSEKYSIGDLPFNIHGCIGYWTDDYSLMSDSQFTDKLIKVAYDATWNDSRRKYFPSIYIDLNAKYKVYCMQLPIMLIDKSTGKIGQLNKTFDNNEFGLIVENNKNKFQRATYLPGVFQNESWVNIARSLEEKAGIATADVSFYAYKCTIFSKKIVDYLLEPIVEFINTKYTNFVPYGTTNNHTIIDKSDHVRNLASIYNIGQIIKLGYPIHDRVITSIKQNLSEYVKKYTEAKLTEQEAAFLLLALLIFDLETELIKKIANNLIEYLNQNKNIDRNFELGEILYAINKSGVSMHPKIDADTNSDLDIFRYNWLSKSINPKYANYLVEKIILFIDKYRGFDETNYIAVEFEALATLYGISDSKTALEIEIYLPELLIKLVKTKNKYGLFTFKNGDARFDITGHVIDGIFALIQ